MRTIILIVVLLFSSSSISETAVGVPTAIQNGNPNQQPLIGDKEIRGFRAGVKDLANAQPVKKSNVNTNIQKKSNNAHPQQIESEYVVQPTNKKKVLPKGIKSIQGDRNGTINIKKKDLKGTKVIETPPFFNNQFVFNIPDIKYHVPEQIKEYVSIHKNGNTYIVTLVGDSVPASITFMNSHDSTEFLSTLLIPNVNVISKTLNVEFSKQDKSTEDTGITEVSKLDKKLAMRSEKGTDYENSIYKILKTLSIGGIPSGYQLTNIRSGQSGMICGEKRLLGFEIR